MLLDNKVRVAKDHGKKFSNELAPSFSEIVYCSMSYLDGEL